MVEINGGKEGKYKCGRRVRVQVKLEKEKGHRARREEKRKEK